MTRQELIEAVRSAYALEGLSYDSLRSSNPVPESRQTILAWYARGFGDSLAGVYADYAMSGGPEPIMVVPDSVAVLWVRGDSAEVAYPTPLTLKKVWSHPDYTVDELVHTNSGWRILRTRRTSDRPPGLMAPPD